MAELRLLTDDQLRRLYRERVAKDFPPAERRPLSAILRLRRRGDYDTWGVFDGDALLAYAFLAIVSVILVSADNFDFETTVGSVITTIGNVGPGLGMTGPIGSFADYSMFSKLVFCIDMLAGRLEIFPFFLLFSYMWRKKF